MCWHYSLGSFDEMIYKMKTEETTKSTYPSYYNVIMEQTEIISKSLDRIYTLALFGHTNTDVLTQEDLKDLFKKIMDESK